MMKWETYNRFGAIGSNCHVENVWASITAQAHTVKKHTVVTYSALVQVHATSPSVGRPDIPPVSRNDFPSEDEARGWCERWIHHFTHYLALEKQLKICQDTKKYYQDSYYALKDLVHEREWEEIRQRFSNPQEGDTQS